MIRDKGNHIELDVVVDKFKTTTKVIKQNGKPVLDENGHKMKEVVEVYKGYYTIPNSFEKDGITFWGPTPNNKNKPCKRRCTIFDKYTQKFYIVQHTKEEIDATLNKRSQVGFKLNQ